jgi:hypothetical protein
MALGKRTGGRKAGTPNRRTQELVLRLEALGVDPVLGLAEIAKDPTVSVDLRARVLTDLMQYVWPKRKVLDVSADAQQPISIRIGIPSKTSPAVEGRSE